MYTPESLAACRAAFKQSIRETCQTEDDFAREYECEHSKSAQLIQPKEYDALLSKEPIPDSLDWGKPYRELYVGIDIGRTKDLTVVWVWERGYDGSESTPEYQRDVFRTVAIDAMFNTQYNVQFPRILQLCSHPQVEKIHIDKGVIGHPLAEQLKPECGSRVEGITLGPASKGPIMEHLRGFVQQKRVLLPDDPDIRSDFLSVRRVPPKTQGGLVRYEGGTAKTHADYYVAAALGLDAAMKAAGITLAMTRDQDTDWSGNWLA